VTEWVEVPLGDIVEISWGDTSTTKASYTHSGYLAYSASGPDGLLPHFDHDQPGVVISAIGAQCGKTWLADGRWSCIKNTMWFRSSSEHLTEYLYYATSNPGFWPRRGAAQPFISLGDAKSTMIRLPPVSAQERITAVLGSIDDLIENNRRRIEVLEEMAQAIYREWFVNFRFPDHEDATFVDSPLGPIPEGWDVRKASEAMAINPRTKSLKDVEDPFFTMGDISERSLVCFPSEMKDGTSGSKFLNGDTLFARITPCLENGKTGYVAALEEGQVGRGSTEFIVLRGSLVGSALTYFLARDPNFRGHAIASMSGASGRQRVRNECFDSYELALPPGDLADQFECLASPMMAQAFSLARQNQSLVKVRDLLLPNLVAGVIDVSQLDLDAVVGAS